MATINFADERLRRAVEETKGAIGERNQNLDRISEDIKQLERYLEASGVRETVQLHLAGGPTALGEPWEFELSGETAAEDVSEFLVWDRLAVPRPLAHHVPEDSPHRIFGATRAGWVFSADVEVLDRRPLIETPAVVRLRASRGSTRSGSKQSPTTPRDPRLARRRARENMKTILKFLSTESKERSRKAKAQ